MQKKYFCAGLVWLCLHSCINRADSKKDAYGKEGVAAALVTNPETIAVALTKLPVCYVLCDFSQSQAADSKADITQNALKIYQQMSGVYALAYININSSQYAKPFFEYVPPASKSILTPKEKKQKMADVEAAKQQLANSLQQLSINDRANNTCIIRALGRVANDLANNPANKKKPIRVIVLSDMLEACSSDFGYINLEKPPYQKALQTLTKMKKPSYTFAGYNDLAISVTASSSEAVADPDGLNAFWKQVLANFGYDFNVPITAELPAWLNQ
jgi:hypothetical protein